MIQVNIMVSDRNDNEPKFQQDVYYFTAADNSDIGTLLGVVTAMDADSASVLQYTFVREPDDIGRYITG